MATNENLSLRTNGSDAARLVALGRVELVALGRVEKGVVAQPRINDTCCMKYQYRKRLTPTSPKAFLR